MRTDVDAPTPEIAGPHGRGPLPRGLGYAAKRAALGPALPTANLAHERLGKVAALAIFSSDALSSVAYATEEMLKTLFIAGVGAVAFTLIVPLSAAIVGVLAILVFSYRQTIKAYPSAGGAYIVTKDNFGLLPGAGGRRRAADRLRPDRRGLGLGRCGRGHRPACPRPRRSASRWRWPSSV